MNSLACKSSFPRDSKTWIIQVLYALTLSIRACSLAIPYLPVDIYIKGFTGATFLLMLGSNCAIAKTLSDREEVGRLTAQIDQVHQRISS